VDDSSWAGLPPASWHTLAHIPASKLGGASHTKVALRLLTNAPPGKYPQACQFHNPECPARVTETLLSSRVAEACLSAFVAGMF